MTRQFALGVIAMIYAGAVWAMAVTPWPPIHPASRHRSAGQYRRVRRAAPALAWPRRAAIGAEQQWH